MIGTSSTFALYNAGALAQLSCVWSVVVLAVGLSNPTGRETAERLFSMAEQEEHDLDLATALDHYDASIAADPSNRWALRATARARWLRARSEGAFAPLARLERVRRDPSAQHDGPVVDALAKDLETFPPGEVRVEARMFVAEAYATRLGRMADGEHELQRLLEEPEGDPPIRVQAATRAIDIAMARGDVANAKQAAEHVAKIEPQLVHRVARWARRRIIERAAVTTLALFVLIGGATAVRRLRTPSTKSLRRFVPVAIAVTVYLAIAAALFANGYERGNALPFLLVPACVFPIVLVARAWALAGRSSRAARVARATFSAAAVLAAAFLVLDGVDVRYLESFGL
jgi:hypothetical protein